MKKLMKLFGIIAIVAVIGFSMTACEEPTDALDDTAWASEDGSIWISFWYDASDSPKCHATFNGGSAEADGNYTLSGNKVTITLFFLDMAGNVDKQTVTGTLSGDTLTITSAGTTTILKKQPKSNH
jgi:uncharacterized lipoprotein YehR (DUF1307 family)